MPLAKTHSVGLLGLTGTLIEVETDISAQLPAFVLVGLPDASLSEATARVRAACGNSGYPLPSKKVVVNLSPAAVPKSGSSFDLAIAVSVLTAMEVLTSRVTEGVCFIGELGLDGALRAVPGVLPMVMHARRVGISRIYCPVGNLGEASMVDGVSVQGVGSLTELIFALRDGREILALSAAPTETPSVSFSNLDLSQVLGQPEAVDGMIVAAAGGHHIAMVGAPGAGKTMLAERLPTILPKLTPEQALEVAAVESIAGDGQKHVQINLTPRFQSPHHTSSTAALIGGGHGSPRPGAVSKAHHGVLFLDEALEFRGDALDSLREPLESGRVQINRSAGSAVFPANFQMVLAANPCPCGLAGLPPHGNKECACSALTIRRYSSRLSGPVLDRIDIRLNIRPVSFGGAVGLFDPGPTSSDALVRVTNARAASRERLEPLGFQLNSQVPGPVLRSKLPLPATVLRTLDQMLIKGKTSMRGYDRCLRLAWTLADLDGLARPGSDQIQMAVALRGSDSLAGG